MQLGKLLGFKAQAMGLVECSTKAEAPGPVE